VTEPVTPKKIRVKSADIFSEAGEKWWKEAGGGAILPSVRLLPHGLHTGHAHDVGKNTGCGDFRARSVALDKHGILAVTLRGEQDDVV